MKGRFAFRNLTASVPGRQSPPEAGRSPGPGSGAEPDGAARRDEPLAIILAALRGRQVTLTVEGFQFSGKLVHAQPVTLVDSAGKVTVIDSGRISSVSY